jgi:DNA-binding transcriptional LysR family regulator
MTALEHELGCTLMNRTQHGVILTESGSTFLSHAQKLLEQYNEMLYDLSSFRHDIEYLQATSARIVVSPACMHIVMTPMIDKFDLRNITLQEITTGDALALMDQTDRLFLVDLFAPFYNEEQFNAQYEVIPLVEARYGIITRKTLLPEPTRSISRETVAQLPLGLFSNETTRAMYQNVFADSTYKSVVLSTISRKNLFENMLSGRLAIIADSFQWRQFPSALKDGPNKVVFAEIEGDYDLSFCFVSRRCNPPNEAMRSYARSFTKVFKARIANQESDLPGNLITAHLSIDQVTD